MVKQTVAFGRRADGPPKQVYHPPPSGMLESFGFDEGNFTLPTRGFCPVKDHLCPLLCPSFRSKGCFAVRIAVEW